MISLGRKFGLLIAVAVICSATTAFADIVKMTFTGPTGPSYYGEQILPYDFTLTGINPPSGTISAGLICDDYSDHISTNQWWYASKTAVPDLPGSFTPYFWNYHSYVGGTGGGYTTGLDLYEEAAWLAQESLNPTPGYCDVATTDCVGDIQWAIWSLFNNVAPPNGKDPFAADWDAKAVAHYAGGNYANVFIYTPLTLDANGNWVADVQGASGVPQEFIGVPEAHTSSLVAAGLLGLLALML